jgi:hypothetical protein
LPASHRGASSCSTASQEKLLPMQSTRIVLDADERIKEQEERRKAKRRRFMVLKCL